ncbi:MAG: histidinol dehydrogenase [Bacteroidetes bacterium]|nr:MAG: histidinol dehydrogenase [Bacteroidota bacterium]
MKRYRNPQKETWSEICQRPVMDTTNLNELVNKVLENVRSNGDQALREYSLRFDGLDLQEFQVSQTEISAAIQTVSIELKEAIQLAKGNIERFHKKQQETILQIETTPGVVCWRESRGIEKVGLYIPGGTAPLFSTVLMLGVPAQLAGCGEIVLCTPPDKNGSVDPAILFTADLVGIKKIFKVGGAQAIAAMAYGTESIPQVYKIFGPGNQYVTKAKELVQQVGTAIDMPAGPSEVLVIADDTCEPAFVAADLLSQAEHGTDSQVILLSTSEDVIDRVMVELTAQVEQLPRKEIAVQALVKSRAVSLETMEQCFEMSNAYAPEHLILASENAEGYLRLIRNAGSVFIGNYSCESAGDYASGTNHTLPTNGYARNYSGVSLDSFVRKITFQKLSSEGIQNIGPAIECMAEAEQLFAHKNAVTLRLNSLKND